MRYRPNDTLKHPLFAPIIHQPTPTQANLVIDGLYGPKTKAAMQAIQTASQPFYRPQVRVRLYCEEHHRRPDMSCQPPPCLTAT